MDDWFWPQADTTLGLGPLKALLFTSTYNIH